MQTTVRHTPVYPFFTNNVRHFVKEMEKVTQQTLRVSNPATNIEETPALIRLQIAVPGLEKKDFEVTVLEKTLEVKVAKEENRETNWIRKEFDFTQFKKLFALPKNIDRDRIEVKYEAGILEIDLYKKEVEEKPKKLLVS